MQRLTNLKLQCRSLKPNINQRQSLGVEYGTGQSIKVKLTGKYFSQNTSRRLTLKYILPGINQKPEQTKYHAGPE